MNSHLNVCELLFRVLIYYMSMNVAFSDDYRYKYKIAFPLFEGPSYFPCLAIAPTCSTDEPLNVQVQAPNITTGGCATNGKNGIFYEHSFPANSNEATQWMLTLHDSIHQFEASVSGTRNDFGVRVRSTHRILVHAFTKSVSEGTGQPVDLTAFMQTTKKILNILLRRDLY